jgi:Dolichyl-phosphate-mannose-protein mannosyltransferase
VAVEAKLTTLRPLMLSRWGVVFAATAVLGIALRVWVYRSTSGTPDADEAVWGLMARHFGAGELATFFWGQAYGGTQEVLLTTPVFWIAGSSWLALRLVPIVLSAVAALLVWRVGRRTLGEPAAAVAAGVFWIWPPFNVFFLTHQAGFYASNVVYCALVLLLALRVVERPDRARVSLLGLVFGLAFWQTAQIVPVAVGVIAWTIWKETRSLRHLWAAAIAACVGALPWIVWNARHGWESLELGGHGQPLQSLRFLASPSLPMITGLRAPYSTELLLPAALTYLIYVALVALFVYGAYRTRHRTASLLYVVVAMFPLAFALSPKTVLALGRPRYLVVLTPLLALLFAQFATRFSRAVAVLAVAATVSVVTLYRMDEWFRATPARVTHEQGLGPRRTAQWVPRDLSGLVSTLDRLGINRVYADYWLAYRLTFDTRERIIATENFLDEVNVDGGRATPPTNTDARYPPYEREVRETRHAFVFYRPTVDTVPIIPRLERLGYRRIPVDSFVVYAPT